MADDPFAHTRMSLAEHLDELRTRLIRGTLAVVVAFVVAWVLRTHVQAVVVRPYQEAMDRIEAHYVAEAERLLAADPTRERTEFFETADPEDRRLRGLDRRLTAIKPGESFLFTLRICFYAALIFGSPVLLWQMWQFIAAGLYEKERRHVRTYFPLSLVAMGIGVVFGYLVVVPYGMYFLNKGASIEVMLPTITAQYFLTFLSGLCLIFGAVFQLPLVMTFLGRAGIVLPATMARYRGHFAVGSFVMAAMLTPPDPFTQLMMAVPLVVLYEVGLVSARVAVRRRDAMDRVAGPDAAAGPGAAT